MSTKLGMVLLLPLLACVPAEREPPAAIWTAADLREAARHQRTLGGAIAADRFISLRGQPVRWEAPPYRSVAVQQAPDADGLTIAPSFSEGEPAAYVTTELWYDLAPVWVQPEYRLVTAWDPLDPGAHLLPGSRPIFSVPPGSPFYSPFWRVAYVVVPADTDPEALRSTKSVLDPGYPIHEGPLRTCALVPEELTLSSGPGLLPTRPLTGEPVGLPIRVRGWAEGASVEVLDFGADRYVASSRAVVREDALFHFRGRPPSGELVDLPLPSVAGVGPYRSHAQPDAPGGVPRFGGLWRLFAVTLPSTAVVFVPAGHEALRQSLLQTGAILVPEVAPELAAHPLASDYLLRVARDGSCFGNDGGFPGGCDWLDAQSRIEALPESSIERTDFTASCALLEFRRKPVGGP